MNIWLWIRHLSPISERHLNHPMNSFLMVRELFPKWSRITMMHYKLKNLWNTNKAVARFTAALNETSNNSFGVFEVCFFMVLREAAILGVKQVKFTLWKKKKKCYCKFQSICFPSHNYVKTLHKSRNNASNVGRKASLWVLMRSEVKRHLTVELLSCLKSKRRSLSCSLWFGEMFPPSPLFSTPAFLSQI